MIFICNQMLWAKYFTRMKDVRLQEQLFYGELQHSKRPRYKLKRCFMNIDKNNIRELRVDLGDREQITVNQSTWKKVSGKCLKHGEMSTSEAELDVGP